MDALISTFPSTPALSSLIQESRLFVSLLLARHTFANDPCDILDLTLKLVDVLQTDPVDLQDNQPSIAKPLDIHLFTLTSLTLLELVDTEDADLVKSARDALSKLHQALERVSKGTYTHLQHRLNDSLSDTPPFVPWPDALLQVINARGEIDQRQQPSKPATEHAESTEKSMVDPRNTVVDNANGGVKKNVQVISSRQQYLLRRLSSAAELQATAKKSGATMTVVDFSLLTRKGYLDVLADLIGF
jgi:hypothetical protein